MKKFITIMLALVAMFGAKAQQYAEHDFRALGSKLAGSWKAITKSSELWEMWSWKNDMLYGQSFRIRQNDTMQLEQVDLRFQNNQIHYQPLVANQNNGRRITFSLVSYSADIYTFENNTHDFPQRIIYHFAASDSLHARIEGTVNGNAKATDFFYTRIRR
jgi:hypothetical protein